MGTKSFLTKGSLSAGLFAEAPRGSRRRRTFRGRAKDASEWSSESGLVWIIWTALDGVGVVVVVVAIVLCIDDRKVCPSLKLRRDAESGLIPIYGGERKATY